MLNQTPHRGTRDDASYGRDKIKVKQDLYKTPTPSPCRSDRGSWTELWTKLYPSGVSLLIFDSVSAILLRSRSCI